MGAGTVLAVLDRDRYEVVPIGILPDGRWVLTRDEPERLAISGRTLPSVAAVAAPDPAPEPAAAPPAGAVPEETTDAQTAAGPGMSVSPATAAAGPVASVPQVLAGVD